MNKLINLINFQVHMLDLETFTSLTRALESPLAPLVILASNRGHVSVHSSMTSSSASNQSSSSLNPSNLLPPQPHGIPPDLLARLLIIPTHPYSPPEISAIIRARARTEGLAIAEPALEYVANLGQKVSLRYALQLLAPARVVAKMTGGRDEVSREDVVECENLFLDVGRSVGALEEGDGSGGGGGKGGWIE